MAVSERDSDYEEKIREILSSNVAGRGNWQPAFLLSHLYLGNIHHAECLRTLRRFNITHVLNCAAFRAPGQTMLNDNPYEGLNIDYHEFPAHDNYNYDITQHFIESQQYIDKVARQNGTVLVHCQMGINRSVAVCVAYLMMHKCMDLLHAIRFVRSARKGVVLANEHFRRLLIVFARRKGFLDKIGKGSEKSKEARESYDKYEDAMSGYFRESFRNQRDSSDPLFAVREERGRSLYSSERSRLPLAGRSRGESYRREPSTGRYRWEPSTDRYRRAASIDIYRREPSTDRYRRAPSTETYRREPSIDRYRTESSTSRYTREPSTERYRREPSTDRYRREPSTSRFKREPSIEAYRREPSTDRYSREPSADRYRREPSRSHYENDYRNMENRLYRTASSQYPCTIDVSSRNRNNIFDRNDPGGKTSRRARSVDTRWGSVTSEDRASRSKDVLHADSPLLARYDTFLNRKRN